MTARGPQWPRAVRAVGDTMSQMGPDAEVTASPRQVRFTLGSGHLSARRPRVAGPPWYGPSLTGVFKIRTCRLFDRKVGGLGLPGLARGCVPELGLAQGDRFNRQTLADAMQSIAQIYASVGSSHQDGTTA